MRGTVGAIFITCLVLCFVEGCGYKTNPRPAAATIPGEIGSIDAFAYPDRVTLRWDVPMANIDGSALKDVSGFKVYRAVRKIGEECENCKYERKQLANVDFQNPTNAEMTDGKVLYTDRDVAPGNAYTYSVNTYNLRGRESRPSQDVTVPFSEPPGSPEALKANISPAGVALEWNLPAEKNGIQGYRVYRGQTDRTENMKPIGTTKADEGSFVDKTAEKGKTYYYVVRSSKMNDLVSMESEPSRQIRISVPLELVEPPENLKCARMPVGIRVQWDRSATSGKEFRYNVYRSEGDKAFRKINVEPIRLPWFTDRNVKRAQTYKYAITAFPEGNPEYESSRSISPAVKY